MTDPGRTRPLPTTAWPAGIAASCACCSWAGAGGAGPLGCARRRRGSRGWRCLSQLLDFEIQHLIQSRRPVAVLLLDAAMARDLAHGRNSSASSPDGTRMRRSGAAGSGYALRPRTSCSSRYITSINRRTSKNHSQASESATMASRLFAHARHRVNRRRVPATIPRRARIACCNRRYRAWNVIEQLLCARIGARRIAGRAQVRALPEARRSAALVRRRPALARVPWCDRAWTPAGPGDTRA